MSTAEPCLWAVPVAADDLPVTLDGVDAVELAELLAFTADALGWRGADVIRVELAAHLHRWAIRLHPAARARDQSDQHAVTTPSVGQPVGGVRDSP